jgi:nifR3 family TIM-barrel protein
VGASRPGLIRPLRFGPLELRSNLFLSPLAGYTNLPFRLAIRALGGLHLCTTDLVNVRSLLRRNPVALQLVATAPADTPLAVQLFGAEPIEMRDAAQMLEAMGVASVDVNMGCPVDKVVRTGSGSLLMTSPQQAAALVGAMAEGVKIPVTAKMRLGWDEGDLSAPDLARRLEDAGAAAVFVHGRTRAQGFSGRVDLRGIRAVVEAVHRIPVIGNGDVVSPEAALRMFDETGCGGVSIGRGAFYDPWIFRNTIALLEHGEAPQEPTFAERLAFMRGHLAHTVEFFGEEKGCVRFRRIAPWYLRNTGPTLYFRQRIQEVRTVGEFDALVDAFREWRAQFLGTDGTLLPYYRPTAMRTVFAGDEDDASGEMRIAVPKGPIAAW